MKRLENFGLKQEQVKIYTVKTKLQGLKVFHLNKQVQQTVELDF